jgi:hypothetical protein
MLALMLMLAGGGANRTDFLFVPSAKTYRIEI